jgi:ribosomal protein S18 acetylase RimI-like enzyme
MFLKLKENVSLSLKAGGGKAALFWFLKRICRMDFYGFFTISLIDSPQVINEKYQLLAISNLDDLEKVSKDLMSALDRRADTSVKNRIDKGGHFYALVENGNPISQLEIYQPFPIDVDTPINLQINMDHSFRFLGSLTTHASYEKQGFATLLISLAMKDIKQKGVASLLTHIRLSNIKSIKAFERNGWQYMGSCITTNGGLLLKKTRSLITLSKI